MHIEWWSGFQFSSCATQLFWVFNQAVYAWIITLMIMRQKTNRYIVLIWSCGLLTCTLPFAGMLPFLIYKICWNTRMNLCTQADCIQPEKTRCLKNFSKKFSKNMHSLYLKSELFTIENILAGGCIGITCFLYEIGNISATNNGNGIHYTKEYLLRYVIFLFVEIGFYAV